MTDDSVLLDSSDDIEDESDVSSLEESQEWDMDGFDYKPIPNDEAGQKKHRYRSQMYQSKGFNVDGENYPGNVAYRQLCPIDLDEPFLSTGLTGRAYMQNMVDLALERYNEVKGLTVTCEYIVRAITAMMSGLKSYITFMARESLDGDRPDLSEPRVGQKL